MKAKNGSSMDQLIKVKVVTLGDASVGKTSLTAHFVSGAFRETYVATVGAGFQARVMDVDGWQVMFQIWDTAGQERFRSLAPFYLRDARVALLVFDVTDQESFRNLDYWIQCVEKNTMNSLHIVIVGNKNDLDDARVVEEKKGAAFAEKHNLVYMETSAKTGYNIQKLFSQIARHIRDDQSEAAPPSPVIVPTTKVTLTEKESPSKSKCCKGHS